MMYTIGNQENYDQILKERILYKSTGGSVWKTMKAALEYWGQIKGEVFVDGVKVTAGIYFVTGDWDKDVDKKNETYGTLNKKLRILKKIT